jgi:hypothetical protein
LVISTDPKQSKIDVTVKTKFMTTSEGITFYKINYDANVSVEQVAVPFRRISHLLDQSLDFVTNIGQSQIK